MRMIHLVLQLFLPPRISTIPLDYRFESFRLVCLASFIYCWVADSL